MDVAILVVLLALMALVVIILVRSVRIIPQARTGIVERLGKYQRTQGPGLTLLVPFIDRLVPLLDMREQVVSFPPQPVITEDNLVVSIDTVVYFQITDPKSATYEIQNYIHAVQELTTTTLRNVVGGMHLEAALTSRDRINGQLRGELDKVTGRWGIRVARVELKAIEPPLSIQDSMEKQMRAERDRRAAILTAEGTKQSAVLTAEGERQAAILQAEGEAQARILAANAEAQAIETVFSAVHDSEPGPELLSYQYLQTLPELAKGDSNTMWVIPGEFGDALKAFSGAFGGNTEATDGRSPEEREAERAAREERLRARRERKEQEAKERRGKPAISDAIADMASSARSTSVTDEHPHYEGTRDIEAEARRAQTGGGGRDAPSLDRESSTDTLKRIAESAPPEADPSIGSGRGIGEDSAQQALPQNPQRPAYDPYANQGNPQEQVDQQGQQPPQGWPRPQPGQGPHGQQGGRPPQRG
ncbi:SPFH domain-containing protein [Nesterenkonia xinjiangensis]|uniref:Regulator of protease activity HflC (Stomatin/prohibitin superfamily) n=1 Tax=Nesterenkonia xinjiangensis TaxID=225327 RepID=A0A7Z0KA78_9MICC|nr:SPFH domain-containing protein [Nesterenkonia xinjiangensis]NYJ79551.1 regulator of protease activity HflC (stomatin/prohibitin superfamily) [Nesterenkonia xinjiangensis]